MKHLPKLLRWGAALVWLVLCAPVLAQTTPVPAAPQGGPILISNVTVHVGNGEVLEGQNVLLAEGKIATISPDASPKNGPGVLRIDGSGKHLYPGLIALNTSLGLVEIGAVRATRDANETGDYNAATRALVGYNTDSHIIPTVRSNGVLLAQIAPGSGVISGRSSLVQLDAWNWEDAALLPDEGLYIRWPDLEAPSWASSFPEAAERRRMRTQEQLGELETHVEEALAYAALKKTGGVERVDAHLEALIPFVHGERRVYIEANNLTQLEGAIAFADKFNLQIAIVGGYEAWRIAPMLAARKIPVILTDIHALPQYPDDDVDLPFRLAGMLREAGVDVAISVQGNWQVFNLPFHAGTAAAYGLTKEQALEAITRTPARILGVDDRLGSIEVGKDATLVLCEGDILDMRTSRVVEAFIEGRRIDLDNKHKQLYRKWKEKYDRQNGE